jgi:hypothetical protein
MVLAGFAVSHTRSKLPVLTAALDGTFTDRHTDGLDCLLGIGRTAVEIITAEIGGDMVVFAAAGRLAPWVGVCPGVKESAGVNDSGAVRPGNANPKRMLCTAAVAAIKAGGSCYAPHCRRIVARRALVAFTHKTVIDIWHVLHDKGAYRDLGADHFIGTGPGHAMRATTRQADALGLTVSFAPITGRATANPAKN